MSKTRSKKRNWTESEEWAWSMILKGKIANFSDRDSITLNPASKTGWEDPLQDRYLSTEFITDILTDDDLSSQISYKGVQIRNAAFKEDIDLQHIILERQLWLENCRFEGELKFMNLHVNGWFSLEESWFRKKIDLSGSSFSSHVSFQNSISLDHISLNSSDIKGFLDLCGCRVYGNLNLNSIQIGQNLHIRNQGEFIDIDLVGAKIVGNINISRSCFYGKVDMNSIHIIRNLFLRQEIIVNKLEFDSARIGGHAQIINSKFLRGLSMEFIDVEQSLFLRNSDLSGVDLIPFSFARVGSIFDLSGSSLCKIDMTSTTITGEMCLSRIEGKEPIKWINDSKMILRNASVGVIQDSNASLESWPNQLELEGLKIDCLGGHGAEGESDMMDRSIEWLLSWLDLDKTYTPQPYEQLARILQDMGYPSKSNRIRYEARVRSRKKAREHEKLRWLGLTLLQITMGYGIGNRYFRVLYWFGGLILLGFIILLLSLEDQKADIFTMIWASFDHALPIIKLNEAHDKLILGIPNNWVTLYFYLQKIFGFILSGFLGAGLAGLTQKS